MAAVDRSLVAELAAVRRARAGGARRDPRRGAFGPLSEEQRRVRAGRGCAFLLRAAARPCARQQDDAGGPADRGALCGAGRDLRRRDRDRADANIRRPRPRSTTASCSPGHPPPGRAWSRSIRRLPPTRCRPSAAGCRKRIRAWSRCRRSRSSGASRMRCCGSPGRPGRKVEQGVEIDFPISRQDIAEMTGTTLHTVSRTLSAWEQQGLVESGRQRIVLRDPHRLFTLAEQARAARPRSSHQAAARSAARKSSRSIPCSRQASSTAVEARDRAADAAHPEVEKHPDRRRPSAHHVVDQVWLAIGIARPPCGSRYEQVSAKSPRRLFAPAQARDPFRSVGAVTRTRRSPEADASRSLSQRKELDRHRRRVAALKRTV